MLYLVLLLTTVTYVSLQVNAVDNPVIDLQELLHNVSASYKNFGTDLNILKAGIEGNDHLLRENKAIQVKISDNSNANTVKIENKLDTIIENIQENTRVLKQILNHSSMESTVHAKDCADVYRFGKRQNGIYNVYPVFPFVKLKLYCDMETDGGGWTVFQRRGNFQSSSDGFHQPWSDYKFGFGNLEKEFWLGNENIFTLSRKKSYQLRVDLWNKEGIHKWAKYSNFSLGNETNLYSLNIGSYSGDAGDSLTYHKNQPFATNDKFVREVCNKTWRCGWWYSTSGHCFISNLNLPFIKDQTSQSWNGIAWNSFLNGFSMAFAEMKIRPHNF